MYVIVSNIWSYDSTGDERIRKSSYRSKRLNRNLCNHDYHILTLGLRLGIVKLISANLSLYDNDHLGKSTTFLSIQST